jgi:flagellar protein FliS
MYGTQAYANVGMESSVMSAGSHKLITLLFDGALSALAKADIYIQQGNIAAKGKNLTHAINIINNGLRVGLDMEHGGELSQNLANLYDYFCRELVHVNRENNLALLRQIRQLLGEIADAWKAIGPENAKP